MPSEHIILTTTTFYKDPDGKDQVRFSLACELVSLARAAGHIVVVVDGSPVPSVAGRLGKMGAHVFPQSQEGMGAARRQVWTEAEKLVTPDVAAVLWTEEKPGIVRLIPEVVACIRERKAHVAVLRRSPASWETYPGFQRESERTVNMVYNKLFPSNDGPFDPMLGPVCFLPDQLSLFAKTDPAAWSISDTYLQHYVPIFMRSVRFKVVPCVVDLTYPPRQRVEEETMKMEEMVERRLWQMRQLVAAYFTIHERLGPVPR